MEWFYFIGTAVIGIPIIWGITRVSIFDLFPKLRER